MKSSTSGHSLLESFKRFVLLSATVFFAPESPHFQTYIMTIFNAFVLALTALHLPSALSFQPDHRLQRRDGNEPFPFCTTATNSNCIVGGKYVKPDLNISDAGNPGNNAYITYLPAHTYTLSQWTNQKMPEMCYKTINLYGFRPADFVVYNVTFSDCTAPWVVCRSTAAGKTINEIADVSRLQHIPKRRCWLDSTN